MYFKNLYFILLLCIEVNAVAQNNSISILLANNRNYNTNAKKLDGLRNSNDSRKVISIGLEYKKILKSQNIIGLRLNFQNSSVLYHEAETFNSVLTTSNSTFSEQEYFIRFCLGKIHDFGKYKIGVSVNLPISFTHTSNLFSSDTSLNLITNNKNFSTQKNYYPNFISTGILLTPTFGYALSKKFCLGMELNTGYLFGIYNGNRRIVNNDYQNNILINHTDDNWKFNINLTQFVFTPNIYLLYTW